MISINHFLFRVFIYLSVGCVFFILNTANIKAQQDGLFDAADTLNNVLLDTRASHSISFTLPSNSFPIRNIDYIQIYLAHFTDITVPTLVTGNYSGIPVFSLSGQYAQVTGITVLPGGRITIDGITAINPSSHDHFQVIVMVTEDAEATRLKNIANFIATLNYANVSVSATLPLELANLRITGWTAPDTFLVFSEASAVIGTDVANGIGGFNRLFTGLQPTTHRISVYGIDLNNLTTSTYPLYIYTAGYQETMISNILLSPTILIDANQYEPGVSVIASGSAAPNSLITVFTDTPMRTYYASASAQGDWNYAITNTEEYVYGDYRIYALAQNEYGLQSLVSNSINFSIRPSSTPGGTACGDISQGDLNCDDDINLTDFSILMYYWGTADLAADINADGLVSLSDFSIMMYWWGT
jgi:hypothetical protein